LPRPRSASAEIALFCAISPLLLILAHFVGGGGVPVYRTVPRKRGRPTRRARRSSSPVDSGISEKSILLSGIGFALFAARLARADDANGFPVM
jgi:hypothetical protein